MGTRPAGTDGALVYVRDLAGRPRGTGFLADDQGTLVTSHEAVDGLARLVLVAPTGVTRLVEADAVTALPEADLAFVRTEGLGVPPLAVAAADTLAPGTAVRLRAGEWRDASVVGGTSVTYAATDRFHRIGTAWELALADGERLGLGGDAAGAPVLDARTGAVVAVLATAVHATQFHFAAPPSGRAGGFAIPLRTAAAADPGGPLAALLDRNAATVPAYGPDLNLAGALRITAMSAPGGVDSGSGCAEAGGGPVERSEISDEFARFTAGEGQGQGQGVRQGQGRRSRPGRGRRSWQRLRRPSLGGEREPGPEPCPGPVPRAWKRAVASPSAGAGLRRPYGRP
ncbi:trypsin-like peptidase domain-containing protein [Streptomyces sp. XD-27]|uniref:trypsin-like peptidase domain-containing protein n=1 Tax=Streptomyces sp. XD-27 TaxID=3062779 RepID=UPI00350E37FC